MEESRVGLERDDHFGGISVTNTVSGGLKHKNGGAPLTLEYLSGPEAGQEANSVAVKWMWICLSPFPWNWQLSERTDGLSVAITYRRFGEERMMTSKRVLPELEYRRRRRGSTHPTRLRFGRSDLKQRGL